MSEGLVQLLFGYALLNYPEVKAGNCEWVMSEGLVQLLFEHDPFQHAETEFYCRVNQV